MSRIPYLFHSFSDFVVYAVTTLIFPKNQWQCAKFSLNAAFLFLSFKRATTVLDKLIDSKHFKQLRRKTLMTFHSPSHFNPKTNFKLLQNDSETGYNCSLYTIHVCGFLLHSFTSFRGCFPTPPPPLLTTFSFITFIQAVEALLAQLTLLQVWKTWALG